MSGRASKRPTPRERTATPAELEDERQHWLRAERPTIRELRHGHHATQEIPIATMAQLIEQRLSARLAR